MEVEGVAAELRQAARSIIDEAIAAVEPEVAVRAVLHISGDILQVAERSLHLAPEGRVLIIGAGKAGVPMARGVAAILGQRIEGGCVVVKRGHGGFLERVAVHEAGHPIPDAAGLAAGRQVLSSVKGLREQDTVICVLSGGGSALLECLVDGIGLEDLQAMTSVLLNCGADIGEINVLRKHLSCLKGGQLARALAPAAVQTLILSDVVGDPIDVIASGPTAPDPTTFADCLAIIDRYALRNRLPTTVLRHFDAGCAGYASETPTEVDPVFDRVGHVIVGNGALAIAAAGRAAERLGYQPWVLSTSMEGETRDVARVHTDIARDVVERGLPVQPPACLLSGGETTVTVRGIGKGGRNQEFVLAAALRLEKQKRVLVCSIGTDGTDGPTDAAGAMADENTATRALALGLDPREHLDRNDAYPLFEALGDLVITGPTRTNVMDLRLVLVRS